VRSLQRPHGPCPLEWRLNRWLPSIAPGGADTSSLAVHWFGKSWRARLELLPVTYGLSGRTGAATPRQDFLMSGVGAIEQRLVMGPDAALKVANVADSLDRAVLAPTEMICLAQ
jgi:hypothetical protein